jgi:hypothetical protein
MQRVVFIDVDDTLIRSAGTKRIPIPAVVSRVRQLKQEGVILYLWSSGGAEYCRSTAVELGIDDFLRVSYPNRLHILTINRCTSGNTASIYIQPRRKTLEFPKSSWGDFFGCPLY